MTLETVQVVPVTIIIAVTLKITIFLVIWADQITWPLFIFIINIILIFFFESYSYER